MCFKDLPKAVEEYAHRSGSYRNFDLPPTDEDSGLHRPSLLIMLGLVL